MKKAKGKPDNNNELILKTKVNLKEKEGSKLPNRDICDYLWFREYCQKCFLPYLSTSLLYKTEIKNINYIMSRGNLFFNYHIHHY